MPSPCSLKQKDPVAASRIKPSSRPWCAAGSVFECFTLTVWYNCGPTQHMQVRNGGMQLLDSNIEELLAEVAASPHDKIDYHDMISGFYFDSMPKQ